MDGTTAYVEVYLKLPGGKSVDLTEEVYSADVTHFQSMDFGPTRMKISSDPLPPSLPLPNSSDIRPTEKKVSSDPLPSPLPLSSVSYCLKNIYTYSNL